MRGAQVIAAKKIVGDERSFHYTVVVANLLPVGARRRNDPRSDTP